MKAATNSELILSSTALGSLLTAMECIVLEVADPNARPDVSPDARLDVRIIGAIPPWFDSIAEADDKGGVDVVSTLRFMQFFLGEAVEFWNEGSLSHLHSDFWTQINSAGDEVHLLAFAVLVEGRRLIVVRSANDLYEDRQRWQLYAHQTFLQLQVIERLKSELEVSSTALQAANAKLSELSIRDGLTGLFNRRHFDQVFELELNRSMRTGDPLSLLFMDIDKFKVLNDTYGHAVGDDCLRAVSKVLGEVVRRPTDIVARFGGEEFAVLLPATGAADALAMATAINKTVRALDFPNEHSEAGPYVTASLGAYTRRPDGDRTTAQILKAVDAALYRAKEEGRNRVIVANKLEPTNQAGDQADDRS